MKDEGVTIILCKGVMKEGKIKGFNSEKGEFNPYMISNRATPIPVIRIRIRPIPVISMVSELVDYVIQVPILFFVHY